MDVCLTFTRGRIPEQEAVDAHRFFVDAIHDSLDAQQKQKPGGRLSSRHDRILEVRLVWRNTDAPQPAAVKVALLDSAVTENALDAVGHAITRLAVSHFKGKYSVMLVGEDAAQPQQKAA